MKAASSVCSTKYKAAHDSGPRRASEIGWVVIHDTEGDTAEGAASWFTNAKSEGSANLVVDDGECYRTVNDLVVPWAAPPLNRQGFHIEIAGHASYTREQWLAHDNALRRAAWKAAQRCLLYNIPIRQVGKIGLRLRRKGITSHAAISATWKQSSHTDPGPTFPWQVFMGYVKAAAAEQAP